MSGMTFWEHMDRIKELAAQIGMVVLGVVLFSRSTWFKQHAGDQSPAPTNAEVAVESLAINCSTRGRDGAASQQPSPCPPDNPTTKDEGNLPAPMQAPESALETEASPEGISSRTNQAVRMPSQDVRAPNSESLDPSPSAPVKSKLHDAGAALFGQGVHCYWQGRYPAAVRNLELAHEVDPDDAAYLYFLALARLRRGQRELAKEALESAVHRETSHPVPDWGRLMERVQGPVRLWVEAAHKRAMTNSPRLGKL